MTRKVIFAGLLIAFATALSGCGSLENGVGGIRVFPPEPADKDVNNSAFLVDRGPYADDCWMYGWGCAPPGTNKNIRIGGPYYNPAPVIYVYDGQRYDTYRDCRLDHPQGHCRRAPAITKP
jgi:hypothetical protein